MLEEDGPSAAPVSASASAPVPPAPAAAGAVVEGVQATALYDYEAGEDNELSFPENAVISNVVSAPSQCSHRLHPIDQEQCRHSLTKTGGTANTMDMQDCSRPITPS